MDLLHEVLCFCYGLFHKAHENKLNISDLVSNKKNYWSVLGSSSSIS